MLSQVDGGHFSSDDQARKACKQLAIKLGKNKAPSNPAFRVLAGVHVATLSMMVPFVDMHCFGHSSGF